MPTSITVRSDQLFTPQIHRELTRLKRRLPSESTLEEVTVNTAAGKRVLPVAVAALLAIANADAPAIRTRDEFAWEVDFPVGLEVEDGMMPEPGAWYGIGCDDGQYHWLVDLDGTDWSDPVLYRADHGGEEEMPTCQPLSAQLAALRRERPPAPADRFARACLRGDLETVAALVADGADLGPVNKSGLTALHLAAMSRSVPLLRALLDAGADPHAEITRQHTTPPRFLEPELHNLSEIHTRRQTPFHTALTSDAVIPADEIVATMLAVGVDADVPDHCGSTPIHYVLAASCRQGVKRSALRLLLAAGADPNARSRKYGTALHQALWEDLDCLAVLLDAGADPTAPAEVERWDVRHLTPLHSAAMGAGRGVLAAMVSRVDDADVATVDGVTALHCAVMRGHTPHVAVLLAAGADPDIGIPDTTLLDPKLRAGKALPMARSLGHTETAAVLEAAGATAD